LFKALVQEVAYQDKDVDSKILMQGKYIMVKNRRQTLISGGGL
jgi:hypothetical protein